MRDSIGPAEVHIWYARPETIDQGLLVAYEALLAPDERAEMGRYRFAAARRQYLVTRAFVRTLLSRYFDVPPGKWTFARNRFGRPEITGPTPIPSVKFSLSHTKGFIACLLALQREVGVDVEETERSISFLETADQHSCYLSPLEAASLSAAPQKDKRSRFFEYWTLKESYLKARGRGLYLPLEGFSIHLGEVPIRISFDPRFRTIPGLLDDPSAWQFALFHPSPHHTLAASVRSGGPAELEISLRQTVPLVS
jgi:4'-phosphopantetheinyl transferase